MGDMENIHKEITIPNRIFLKGFEFSTEEEDLQNIFAKYGSIRETKIIRDARTGQSKGFGFITFDSQQVTEKVLETCKSVELSGVEITVGPAKIRRRPPKYLRGDYNSLVNSQFPQPPPLCAVSPDGLFTMFYPTIPILPPYAHIPTNSVGVSPLLSSHQASMNGKPENHMAARPNQQQFINEFQIPLSEAASPQIGKLKIQDDSSVGFHNTYCEMPTLSTNAADCIPQHLVSSTSMVAHSNGCQGNPASQIATEIYADGRRASPTFHDSTPFAKGLFQGPFNGFVNCGRSNTLPETQSLGTIFHGQCHRSVPNGMLPSTYGPSTIPGVQEVSPGPVNGHIATINGHVTTVNSHGTNCSEANLNLNHLSTKAVHTTEHSGMFAKPAAMQYIPLPLFHADAKKEQSDVKSQDFRIIRANANTKEHYHSKMAETSVANIEFKAGKSWKSESFVFMTAGPGKVKRVVVR